MIDTMQNEIINSSMITYFLNDPLSHSLIIRPTSILFISLGPLPIPAYYTVKN